jgi:drug/metabolite transporter (DMT)-like permease
MAVLSALAFGTWSVLLKFNPVGRVAVFNFLTPVFGVALSALIFLGENMCSPGRTRWRWYWYAQASGW